MAGAIRRFGNRLSLVALALFAFAPVLHVIAYPDHVLGEAGSYLSAQEFAALADHGTSAPATPHKAPTDHCTLCQTLSSSLAAGTPEAPVIACLAVLTAIFATAPPRLIALAPLYLRPPGRAPPTIS